MFYILCSEIIHQQATEPAKVEQSTQQRVLNVSRQDGLERVHDRVATRDSTKANNTISAHLETDDHETTKNNGFVTGNVVDGQYVQQVTKVAKSQEGLTDEAMQKLTPTHASQVVTGAHTSHHHQIPENMAHETPDKKHGVQAASAVMTKTDGLDHVEDEVPMRTVPLAKAPPHNGADLARIGQKAVFSARKALETGHPGKVLAAKCKQMHGLTFAQVWGLPAVLQPPWTARADEGLHGCSQQGPRIRSAHPCRQDEGR